MQSIVQFFVHRWEYFTHLRKHWLFVGSAVMWGLWANIRSLPDSWQNRLHVSAWVPEWSWYWWLIGFLVIFLLMMFEASFQHFKKSLIPADNPHNLQGDFAGLVVGKIYLKSDGIWSSNPALSAPSAHTLGYMSYRMRVTNNGVEGKKIGPAKNVIVQVEFHHDTGSFACSGAPTAWMDEKFGRVTVNEGEHKEVIIAVAFGEGMNATWHAITNVRRVDGLPDDVSAMKFSDTPWFDGTVAIRVIVNGEMQEGTYSWELDNQKSAMPFLRPIKLPLPSSSYIQGSAHSAT